MNIYQTVFEAKCPNNDRSIHYELTIVSRGVIMVEEITDKCDEFQIGYHEYFADVLYDKFGGHQKIVATHHGVKITTIRGAA